MQEAYIFSYFFFTAISSLLIYILSYLLTKNKTLSLIAPPLLFFSPTYMLKFFNNQIVQPISYFSRFYPVLVDFPIFAVTLLYLGFVNGLVAASAGTDATIKLSRRGTKYAVDKVWGGGAKPYLEEKFKTREKTGKAIDWAEQNKFMGATKLRSLIPMAARDYAAQRPHIADAQKEVANSSSPSIGHRIAYGDLKGEKAVGGMMELVARGDFQDYFKAFQDKFLSKKDSRLQIMDSINYNRPSGRKITNIDDLEKEATASELQEATMGMSDFRTKSKGFLQLAMNAGYQSNLLRSSPRMAKVAAGLLPGYDKLNEDQAVEKAVNEARNQHIKNWEKEELDDEKVIEYGMTRGRDFWQAVQSNVKKGHETALETVAGIFNKFIQSSGSGFQGADLSNEAVRKKAWSEFRNNFKTTHNGHEEFFQYMDMPKAREQGWTPERVIYLARRQSGNVPSSQPSTPGSSLNVGGGNP